MSRIKHKVSVPYRPSFRNDAVSSLFDVPVESKLTREWDIELPIEDLDWQIGLIVGNSGTGKTTIAKHVFGDKAYHSGYTWDSKKSIIDNFPPSSNIKEISKALSSVGFSSPPNWLRPFHVLSNGEKFRAEIARLLIDNERYPELVVLDEFTSVVDRTVAKASSAAVSRYIRATKKKFVAVSCHSDIIEWLSPDWVLDMTSGEFLKLTGRSERRSHPPIELTIRRVARSAWERSGIHHFHPLNPNVIRSIHLYAGFWEERLVAMVGVVYFPHRDVKMGWRSSRTVVFPDFQGLRIGVAMNDAIAAYYTKTLNQRFFGKSTHPAMNAHRRNSRDWMLFTKAGMAGKVGPNGKISGQSAGRATESFEFVGHIRGSYRDKECGNFTFGPELEIEEFKTRELAR